MFLFPSSSPEEGGKSWKQRGSTALGQANHVDALFPQSPEETFPSSPESVPTHGVSSALASPRRIVTEQSDTAAILPVNVQEEDVAQADILPVDFLVQTVPHAKSEGEPVVSEFLLSEAEVPSSRQQVETIRVLLPSEPSDPETQTLLIPEPEREDSSRQSQELSALPANLPPSLLAMFLRPDAISVPASEHAGPRDSLSSWSLPATILPRFVPQEDTPPTEVGRTSIAAEEKGESPLMLPFPTNVRRLAAADTLDFAPGPALRQREATVTDAQQLFSLTTQAERPHSVGQPGPRSYPIENTQGEIYRDAPPGPTLPLDGSAEGQLQILSRDTHPSVAEGLRRAHTHLDLALPSPEVELLPASTIGLSMPHSSSSFPKLGATSAVAVVEQVAGQIATHITQGSKQAILELEPQELGRVQIDLVLQGDQVQVRIVTETAEVSTLIQTHLLELKTALQHHNLELGPVSVEVNARDGDRGTFAHDAGQHFGTHTGGNRGEPPTQQQDTERTEHRRPTTASPLSQQGVSVWA